MLQRLQKSLRERFVLLKGSREKIFEQIYQTNKWGSEESVSGRGSELGRTTVIRRELPSIIASLDVGTILDLPCGDLNLSLIHI